MGVVLTVVLAGCTTQPPIQWESERSLEITLHPTAPRTFGPSREIIQGGKLVFDAVIDTGSTKKTIPWLFDTGAGFPLLDGSLAQDLTESALVIAAEGERPELGGLGKGEDRARVLPGLEIPGVCKLANVELTGSRESFAARGYQGVVGPRAFPGRAVIVDAARQRLVLVPRADLDALLGRPGTVVIHGRLDRGVLYVPVRIGLTDVEMIVDTGSGLTNVTGRLGSVGVRLKARTGDIELQGATISVVLGGVDLGKHPVFVSPRYSFAVLGTNVLLELGRPFLIDVEGERIALLP